MRSGLEGTSNRNYGAWVTSADWVRHALARPMFAQPGETMEYSTGNTHLLSAILTKATGRSTWQFANETLARPLRVKELLNAAEADNAVAQALLLKKNPVLVAAQE